MIVFNVGRWRGNGRLGKGLELVFDKVVVVAGGKLTAGEICINGEAVGARVSSDIDIIVDEDER